MNSKIENKFRETYHDALGLPKDFNIDCDQEVVDMFVHFANGYKARQKEVDDLEKKISELKEEIEDLKKDLYEHRKYEN
jgi:cell division protein FtsL